MYGITLRFSRRYGRLIKPVLIATFKFRIRGVAELPRKRHGAKTSILSMARRLGRSLIELDRSGNLYRLASKFHGIQPAIKSIKKDLRPRYAVKHKDELSPFCRPIATQRTETHMRE